MDKNHFLDIVCKEEERLKGLCQYWENVAQEESVPDDGRIPLKLLNVLFLKSSFSLQWLE